MMNVSTGSIGDLTLELDKRHIDGNDLDATMKNLFKEYTKENTETLKMKDTKSFTNSFMSK